MLKITFNLYSKRSDNYTEETMVFSSVKHYKSYMEIHYGYVPDILKISEVVLCK